MSHPTTVVGSYSGGSLELAVADQLAAGIDLLSDGQTRADMIGAFLRRIHGCERRPDGRWVVTGRIGAPARPITVADWQQAAQIAQRPVKGILTGPTTLACAVAVAPGAPYGGPGDAALVSDFAAVLAAEAGALARAGARVIQIDEPFFSIGADLGVGLNAIRTVAANAAEPWLHCCGDVRVAWPQLRTAPVAVLQIEGTNAERLPPISDGAAPALAFGVIDSSTDEVERLEQVAARIAHLRRLGARPDCWLSPDCGLRLRSPESARAKLDILVRAAALA